MRRTISNAKAEPEEKSVHLNRIKNINHLGIKQIVNEPVIKTRLFLENDVKLIYEDVLYLI